MSSNPTTERSWGTFNPNSWRAASNAKCHDIICAENTLRPRLACEQPLRHGIPGFATKSPASSRIGARTPPRVQRLWKPRQRSTFVDASGRPAMWLGVYVTGR